MRHNLTDARSCRALSVLLLAGLAVSPLPAAPPPAKPVTPPPPPAALLRAEDWQQAPLQPATPEEIDQLLAKDLDKRPAPLTTDEEFLRRLTLDVAGRLPTRDEVQTFLAGPDPGKRARAIDRLLDGEEFARHWGRYWTEVVSSRVSPIMQRLAPQFEQWLVGQLQQNRGWGAIVRDILTADAVLVDTAKRPPDVPRFVPQPRNGAAFFIATRYYEKTRTEGAIDLAAETSRIFLGLQLQCAQCHDHPFDQWHRTQFHQLAAFFARSGGRPRGDANPGALGTIALVYYPDGEYETPDEKEPSRTSLTHPAFLDGASPGTGLDDRARRAALADFITDKKNFWFAAAFINRAWGELTGQAFYQPMDDLGPQRDVVQPAALARLAGAFRGTDHDVKQLFRTLLNTQAYQRQFRLGDTPGQHLLFSASSPTRLRAPVVARLLFDALALDPPPARSDGGKYVLPEILATFDADPSARPEASLSQALLMMNSYFVNSRIPATGANPLARILKDCPDDGDALRVLYLRTLGRKPTDRELDKCRLYVQKVGKRTEAFEDLFWALLNSPEFQTKR